MEESRASDTSPAPEESVLLHVEKLPRVIEGPRRRLFVRLVLNGAAQATVAVGTVLLIRLSFDRLIQHELSGLYPLMLWIGLGFLATAASMAWLRMMERIDSERMGQGYTHGVRMLLFDHLCRISPRSLQKRGRGAVVLRFVSDLSALRRWVSLGFSHVTVAGITIIGTVAALAVINLVLALGVAVSLLFGIFYSFRVGKPLGDAIRVVRRHLSRLATNVNEKVATMAVVQAFGQGDRERKRINRQSRKLRDAMVDQAKHIGLLRSATQITTAVSIGGIILLGAHEVAAGRASHGTVVAAMTIAGMLVHAVRDLGRVLEYWHGAQVSTSKINEFLATTQLIAEAENAPDLMPGPGHLEFECVGLKGVFQGLTAIARPGKLIALVGPNGSGKSTLLSLAVRMIDPDEGRILLGGQDISMHSLSSLRRATGMVSPDLPLLRGTVDRNLRYRWPGAPKEEVERVRALCEIDKLMAELPKGDRTRLTEGGGNLSLGQRQMIALARALLGNPCLLLLDEADAHLDDVAYGVLERVLSDFQGTVIMVTHRLDRRIVFDEIWSLENGAISVCNTAKECAGVSYRKAPGL